MYFEDLTMRSSINWASGSILVPRAFSSTRPWGRGCVRMCVSASKWRVSLVREDWADKCSLCFAGLACKLAGSLVNGININVPSITLSCLPVWITCEHCIFELTRILKSCFTARKGDGSWNRVLKLSSCQVRRLKQFISCNLPVTCKIN